MPYSYTVGYDGVGNVTSMNDSIMGQWTFQTPGYDALNRLVNGAAITGPYANKYACWTYDAYGNQTMEAISSTACNNSPTPTTWAHYNTNNRITGTGLMPNGLGYDAAGDVVNDGTNMYEYDAEGRQTGVLSLTTMELTGYVYDAEGRRIEKVQVQGWNTPNPQSVIQDEYLLGLNGEQVTVLDGSGIWQWSNVYAGGKQLATDDSAGTHFTLTDWLGTKRMQLSEQVSGTTATVSVGEQCTSLPFGDGLNCTGSDVNQLHFTGKERDTESGNDYFDARYYASSMGRFLSPDDPILYQDKEDPQTWNLYNYVGNNPLNRVDPNGHLTVIVPGTGFTSSDWNMNMKLVQEARAEFHDPDVRILNWDSALGGGPIEAGAQNLINVVNNHSFAPGEQLNIIGHSRGGDVAIDAVGRLNHKVDNLITLATPKYDSLPGTLGNVGTWINVSTTQDWIAALDSQTLDWSTRTFAGAHNIELNANGYNHVTSHGAVWQNDYLRQLWWNYWQQNAGCQESWDPSTNTLHGCR